MPEQKDETTTERESEEEEIAFQRILALQINDMERNKNPNELYIVTSGRGGYTDSLDDGGNDPYSARALINNL